MLTRFGLRAASLLVSGGLLLAAACALPYDGSAGARLVWPEVAECMRLVNEASYPGGYGPTGQAPRAIYYGELASRCMARHADSYPRHVSPPPLGESCYSVESRAATVYFDSGSVSLPAGYAAAVCAELDYGRFYGGGG